jgi:hypothetical protein
MLLPVWRNCGMLIREGERGDKVTDVGFGRKTTIGYGVASITWLIMYVSPSPSSLPLDRTDR